MRIAGGWRGKRGIAVAVLVAAGLAVTTTGAASAGEPDEDGPDVVIVTCVDGEPVVREPTVEERERFRTRPIPPERVRVHPDPSERVPGDRVEGETRVLPEGGVVRVVPAEPGEPPVECDTHVPPHAERGERVVVPALPR
jgi:hypothetical protein